MSSNLFQKGKDVVAKAWNKIPKIQMSNLNQQRVIFGVFAVFSIGAYTFYETSILFMLDAFNFIHKSYIVWLICFIVYAGKSALRIFQQSKSLKTDFDYFLNPFLEIGTYGIILQSSFTFLYAVMQQTLINNEVSLNGYEPPSESASPFNVEFFSNFDYLFLSVAAIYLIILSLLRMIGEIINIFTLAQLGDIEEAVSKEEFEANQTPPNNTV
ncbi:MAG: hypothetical protein AAF599_08880 [Bacteroidota bacterium]